jgi:hypothetical protein
MTLVFHSERIFYIQVMEKRSIFDDDDFVYVNSQLIEFDFQYAHSLEVIQGDVVISPDMALFEAARTQNYSVFDYRSDLLPATTITKHRYDVIFYRYNTRKAVARLIFYKKNNDVATVVEYRLEQVKPEHLLGFVSLMKQPALAFITFRTREMIERKDGNYSMIIQDQPTIAKITLSQAMETYQKETFSLASALSSKLTLNTTSSSSSMSCAFCGDPAHMKDSKTNHLYCDHFCQRLFCQTYRLC